MSKHRIVTIGGSAGAVNALLELVPELPADLPASVLVAVHTARDYESTLDGILGHAGRLPCAMAHDLDPIVPGQILVAPADRHLLVRSGRVRLSRGPREHAARPAIDPLFRTAAVSYGPRVVGVLLSGWLDDGADGLRGIQRCGGVTVVQDPADAFAEEMPRSGLELVKPDYLLSAAEIGRRMGDMVTRPPGPELPVPADLLAEDEAIEQTLRLARAGGDAGYAAGVETGLMCPDCGGALRDLGEQYRCRVGHAFSHRTLAAAQGREIEGALWSAVRQLEAHAELLGRLAARARQSSRFQIAEDYEERRREAEGNALAIRRLVLAQQHAEQPAAAGQ